MGRLTGDQAFRIATAIVVVSVAAFAAIQSFSHISWLARTHGQGQLDSALLPLSVDGLILAMTLVLLHEARAGRSAPYLAYLMLWFGIAATVAANIIFGYRFGVTGAAVSAWPAVAFIGAVHVVASVVRSWNTSMVVPGGEYDQPAVLAVPSSAVTVVPDRADEAVSMYRDRLTRDDLPSIRQIKDDLGVGQTAATRLQRYLKSGWLYTTVPEGDPA